LHFIIWHWKMDLNFSALLRTHTLSVYVIQRERERESMLGKYIEYL